MSTDDDIPADEQEFKRQIGSTLRLMVQGMDKELFSLSSAQLAEQWFFHWDEQAALEWNIYNFTGMLDLHRSRCRRWEEHHHGSMMVVERVRDKYLMPRIKAFALELEKHFT